MDTNDHEPYYICDVAKKSIDFNEGSAIENLGPPSEKKKVQWDRTHTPYSYIPEEYANENIQNHYNNQAGPGMVS